MKALLTLLLVSSSAYAQVQPIIIDPIPLPEPGTIALVSLGAGVLLLRHIKRKR